jgi:hypothetical protein
MIIKLLNLLRAIPAIIILNFVVIALSLYGFFIAYINEESLLEIASLSWTPLVGMYLLGEFIGLATCDKYWKIGLATVLICSLSGAYVVYDSFSTIDSVQERAGDIGLDVDKAEALYNEVMKQKMDKKWH